MDKIFETAISTRKALLEIMDSAGFEQLVRIPEPHRNSIFWNIAHLLVTEQLLTYKLSGLDLHIDPDFVSRYMKGTKGNADVSLDDVAYVRENLVKTVERTRKDYEKGLFKNYQSYTTSANVELKSIEDGIHFSCFHDGIHFGVVLSLMKIVK